MISAIEGAKITQPDFMKDISVAHKYAEYIPEVLKPTRVHAYLLMSRKDAITNWHVDFSWTSVFYFVVSGVKEFVVVENCRENSAIFSDFHDLKRKDLFFGTNNELTGPAKRQIIIKNQGVIMPAGTIHMVRTAETSVAYGINFIHEDHFREAILYFIGEREKKEDWDKCFPNFIALMIAVLGRAMAFRNDPATPISVSKFQLYQLIYHVLWELQTYSKRLTKSAAADLRLLVDAALGEFTIKVCYLTSIVLISILNNAPTN